MTVKEIAKATGKQERAVHNWAKETSAKNADIYAKIAKARRTSKPADYTLGESCQIIETGMGKTAADVYRTNAANAELKVLKSGELSGAKINALLKAVDKGVFSVSDVRSLVGLPSVHVSAPVRHVAQLPARIQKSNKQPTI